MSSPHSLSPDAPSADSSTSTRDEVLARAVQRLRDVTEELGLDALVVTPRTDPKRAGEMLEALHGLAERTVVIGLDEDDRKPLVIGKEAAPDYLVDMLQRIVGDQGDVRAGGAEDLRRRAVNSTAAEVSGQRQLSEVVPEEFAVLTNRYRAVLLASLEQRAYRIDRDLRPRVVQIAADLAALGADPRDCIAIQSAALEPLTVGQPESLLVAAREESTMLLVELLGYLVRLYRDAHHSGPRRGSGG